MRRDRYQRLREIFHCASELAGDERAGYLELACAGDADLFAEVSALIATEAEADGFLEDGGPATDGGGEETSEFEVGEALTMLRGVQPELLSGLDHPPVLDCKYRLGDPLGEGGMGEVFRAVHLGLKKDCAVKLMHREQTRDEAFMARFRTEAEALGRLEHPSIVSVTDFGVHADEGGIPYLVTELLEGASLDEELAASGVLDPEAALPLLDRIAVGLDHAHRCGVVHGDLKPRNVFLVDGGDREGGVKILDFGLAHLTRPQADSRGGSGDRLPAGTAVIGTPAYMAPELLAGREPTRRSDVYAFGVLVYEVLTGTRPFDAPDQELASRTAPPDLPSRVRPGLPAGVDEPLLRALDADPALRPSSATELVSAVHEAVADDEVRRWRRREWPRRSFLAVLLAPAVAWVSLLIGQTPLLRALDHRLGDARVLLASPTAPDPRLVIVTIDEQTLASEPQRTLGERADEVGQVLEEVLEAGAAAIGIDLLLPEKWGKSAVFGGLVVRNPGRLVLAALSTADGGVTGPQSLSGLATVGLGEHGAARLFGFVNVLEDADGRVRRMRRRHVDLEGRLAPSFAGRAARLIEGPAALEGLPADPLLIDYTIDWRQWNLISWIHLSELLHDEPEAFRGKLVLVGTQLAGSGDVYSVPHPHGLPDRMPGIMLQATMTNTLLSGAPIREISRFAGMCLLASVALLVLAAALCHAGPRLVEPVAVSGAVAVLAMSVLAFIIARSVTPMVSPLLALALSGPVGLGVRRLLPPRPES